MKKKTEKTKRDLKQNWNTTAVTIKKVDILFYSLRFLFTPKHPVEMFRSIQF